jgi:hypothetical protein
MPTRQDINQLPTTIKWPSLFVILDVGGTKINGKIPKSAVTSVEYNNGINASSA